MISIFKFRVKLHSSVILYSRAKL